MPVERTVGIPPLRTATHLEWMRCVCVVTSFLAFVVLLPRCLTDSSPLPYPHCTPPPPLLFSLGSWYRFRQPWVLVLFLSPFLHFSLFMGAHYFD